MLRLKRSIPFSALAALLFALAATGCGGETPSVPAETPTPPGATETPPEPSPSPIAPPEEVASQIEELGTYAVEVASGRIWRVPDDSVPSAGGVFAAWGEEGLDVIDLSAGTALRVFHRAIGPPSWSPDGERLALVTASGEGLGALMIVDRDGGNLRAILEGNLVPGPLWSPVGDQIAVVRRPLGAETLEAGPAEIVLVDADTGKLKMLASDLLWGRVPPYLTMSTSELRWAPDGRRLLALGVPEDLREERSRSGTYVLDTNGSEPRKLLDYRAAVEWSPAGGLVALTRLVWQEVEPFQLTETFVEVLDPDTAEVTTLSEGAYPSWSPDGERLAFQADLCRDSDIILTDADGGGRVKLTDLGVPMGSVEWSPASDQIAYLEFGEPERVRIVEGATGELSELAEVVDRGIGLRGLEWSPDGKYLLFGTGSGFSRC